MRRRDFLALLGGAVLASPVPAFAQTSTDMRRVGALFSQSQTDPEGQARLAAFRQGLQELGWVEGRNVHIEYRWAAGGIERMRPHATDLVALKPDVILASATTSLTALQQATRTIPIVFAQVTDPVGAGFVASLSRPGGNITDSRSTSSRSAKNGWNSSRRLRPG
jgi:putative tryptophan/tyrosine transport system substrate-binding protein